MRNGSAFARLEFDDCSRILAIGSDQQERAIGHEATPARQAAKPGIASKGLVEVDVDSIVSDGVRQDS